jgi:uncharacterized Tic20 family protein
VFIFAGINIINIEPRRRGIITIIVERRYREVVTMPEKEERIIAMLIYLVSFVTTFIGPLVICLVKKNDSEFIDYHGREYLNFLITMTVYSIISAILVVVLIGLLLLWIIGIAALILTIVAAIKAYEGEHYRFPFIFRIL